MANLEGTPPLKALFADIVGAYGKRKGAPDFMSLRRTLNLGRAGETLGLFPEGDRSWDGLPSPFRPGLGKLLRMLGMPVLLARQEGAYLSGPRWASLPRQGRWNIIFHVFSRERVLDSPPNDLEKAVWDGLNTDDMRNPALQTVRFECEAPAKGIERLLWLCPICGESDSISGADNRITCTACGTSWIVDGNQRIENHGGQASLAPFEYLRGWSDLQKTILEQKLNRAQELSLFVLPNPEASDPLVLGEKIPDLKKRVSALVSDGVELLRKTREGVSALGRGRLTLFRDVLAFRAEGSGRHALFDVGKVQYFVDNFNAYSEFTYGPERYRILFKGGNSMKWIHALSILQNGSGGVST